MVLHEAEESSCGLQNPLIKRPSVPGSINSHYFYIIGDGKLNPIVGVYRPIIRIPIKGGMSLSPI